MYFQENIDCNFEIEEMVPPNATISALDKLNAVCSSFLFYSKVRAFLLMVDHHK